MTYQSSTITKQEKINIDRWLNNLPILCRRKDTKSEVLISLSYTTWYIERDKQRTTPYQWRKLLEKELKPFGFIHCGMGQSGWFYSCYVKKEK